MRLVRLAAVCCSLLFLLAYSPGSAGSESLLFRQPSISRTRIAFVYGGDIWTVGREGGQATRLVTGYGLASAPFFSPDGSKLAFSANYDGNVDVYVVPATGGEPKRLTYHPNPDVVTGWTNDGSRIVFASGRESPNDSTQLYTISVNGGLPSQIPLPDVQGGTYSPDGSRFAYVPNGQWEPYWRDYRGGQETPIWIANLSDSSVEKILTGNENYRNPMWIGDRIYYLSDREGGSFTLYAYDLRSHASTRLVENHRGFDITSANAGDGAIVYAQLDAIHVYDTANGTDRRVPIAIAADMPQVRPHWIPAASQIQQANVSPTGVRAVFEAHGDILTVPAEHGSIRNLTQTPGAMERDPAWSPNGKWIAYFSDASGEYTLRIKDQLGRNPAREIPLTPSPSFYYSPLWSPDSKRIAYADKHLGYYYVDVSQEHPHAVKFGEALYEFFSPNPLDASWSPDSRYIAYSGLLRNFLHAIFVYDTTDGHTVQITDGMSDATRPAFDKSGKYLYFVASTNTGFNAYGLDMESDERPTSDNVYAVTLQRTDASPVSPQSDEEEVAPEAAPAAKPAASAKPAAPAAPATPAIDFENIGQRIVTLPLPEANYVQLQAAAKGQILVGAAPIAAVSPGDETEEVYSFDLESRRPMLVASGVTGFEVTADGKKMLVQQPGPGGADRWSIVSAAAPMKPGDGALDLSQMNVYSVPQEEWAQMYRETWRIERDFFYDPHYHGLNIQAAQQRFSEFLPAIASREDFTYLTEEMIGYLEVGHLWVGGPRQRIPYVPVGLLGADYTVDNGHYRFAKIYNGENWNPDMRAPLTQPGVNVHAGDYLLAVNGQPVRADREVYAAFEETAGKQTTITVGPNPSGSDSRDVVVIPVPSEHGLRYLAWIESNRRLVDRLSDGKIGYVHLPDTEYGGFTNFNRYFFAEIGKQGIILDERYNHGGQIADYVIDVLSRKVRATIKGRDGLTYTDPPQAIYGPKVMVINQYAGSGGDAMPWIFRKAGLGPLVGVRTWGGLVGIGGYPTLMDGGVVMAPRVAIGGLHGNWEVEGHGISPDIEVQQDPKAVREGHDPQLEAAVETAMKLLREHPVPNYQPPAYPDHSPQLPPK